MQRELPQPIDGHLKESLQTLCSMGAPSGHEDQIVRAIFDHFIGMGFSPEVDRLGQVSVTLVGTDPAANRTLVSAHLDQLGLVVSNVREDGFIKFERLGGVPERVLPGTRVSINTRSGNVPGVVGLKSHHLTPPDDKYKALPASELYIDVGALSFEEVARLGITIGDPCIYEYHWTDLANGRFSSVSLDDRLGVVALLALVDRLHDQERAGTLHIAFTTQEEFHVRGTLALVEKYQPDIVLNVDVTPAADTPDLAGATAVSLGGGPVINRLSFHGRGTLGGLIPHPALLEAAEQAALTACTKHQYEVIIGLINDAAFVPMATAKGVATIGISIPIRYTHSPVETGELSDLEETINLLQRLTDATAYLDLSRVPRTPSER
jgi:putative aminopeptidase FrvX